MGHLVTWQCGNKTCTAQRSNKEDGACGSANGKTYTTNSSPQNTDLCDDGTSNNFKSIGSGWTWDCEGICGGGTAHCSAKTPAYIEIPVP